MANESRELVVARNHVNPGYHLRARMFGSRPTAAQVRGRATARPRDPGADPQWAILEASPNAIVAVDERGLIHYLNSQAEATFGYARAEAREARGAARPSA